MQFFSRVVGAFQAFEKRFLAQEVFGLFEQYKTSSDIKVTQTVHKVFRYINFHTIDLEPTSLWASQHLKTQAMLLAPRLQDVKALQNSRVKVSCLSATNCLLADAGVIVECINEEDGKRLRIRTSRTSSEIIHDTEESSKFEHYPDPNKPEPWMKM